MLQNGRIMMRVLALVFVLFVVVYMGLQIYNASHSVVRTEPVVLQTDEEVVAARGVAVREEQVLPRGSGIVEVIPSEGEKVAAGDALAFFYADQAALDAGMELDEARQRLARLNDALAVQGSADVETLERGVLDAVLEIASSVGDRDLGTVSQAADSLRDSLFRRGNAFEDAAPLERERLALLERIEVLEAAAPKGQAAYYADEAGYFSVAVDGYESALTPEILEEAVPSLLESLQPVSPSGQILGKLVGSHIWRLALTLPEADALRMTPGGAVTVRLSALPAGTPMPMTVERIGPAEEGTRVVVLTCGTALAQTIGLRSVRAEVILRTSTGLRVPFEAIRPDPENPKLFGVYCAVAGRAVWKPVTDVYRRENYWLVEYKPGLRTSLLPSDEVIVAAMDLFNGKPLE